MKLYNRVCAFSLALALILPCYVSAAEVDTEMDKSPFEAKIGALLESKNPKDHLAAVKLLDQNHCTVEESVYNEYDEYLNIKKALEAMPATAETVHSAEISELQTFVNNFEENFAQKIKYLNTLTDEQLRFVNYRDDQIEAIRNFDGSEEMMRASSSECHVYGGFTDFKSSSSKSSATLIAAFEWEGLYSSNSLFATKDIFGVTWISPFASDTDTEEAYISYKNVNTGTAISSVEYATEPEGMFASSVVFKKSKMGYVGDNPVGHNVDAGSIICYLDTYTKETQVLGFAKYGKTTASGTPSFNIEPDGVGLSISYSEKVTDAGKASFRYPE